MIIISDSLRATGMPDGVAHRDGNAHLNGRFDELGGVGLLRGQGDQLDAPLQLHYENIKRPGL
mgnify:CR=1 FL=1